MSEMRAAVVGLGWWGRQLVQSLAESTVVRVTDAVEPRMSDAASFVSHHDLALHETLDEVLASGDVDGVLIATPHRLHPAQVLASARAGKHVFCEKPLALDAASAREMIAACRERGLVLGVGHERRYEGALEAMADMASSGSLGTLLHIECNWSHDLFAAAGEDTWRRDPSEAPLGTLTALGVHITDYFQSIAGPVGEVAAAATHRSDRFASEDVITVQFRFRSGVTGTMTNLATTPFYSRISVFGDQGWAEAREWSNVDIPEPALLMWQAPDHEIRTRTFAATDTVRANVEAWAHAALGGGAYRFSADQLLHNVEILEAIVDSATSGTPVTIR
jgi:predicted dehydrogenase